jgi:hypothetical protein
MPATTRRATRSATTKASHRTATDKPKIFDKAPESDASQDVELTTATRRAKRPTATKVSHHTALDKPKILDKAPGFRTSQKVNLLPPTRRITRLMTTDVPRRAALDTTEILDKILTFLSPRTLFGIQRVSRQWKDLIARSPPIQEKMFLRCQARAPEVWTLTNPKSEPDIPPAEMRALRYNYFELRRKFHTVSTAGVESGTWKSKSGGTQQLFTPVTLNPWLRRRSSTDKEILVESTVLELHNSLRNAYLTEPPCKEVKATMVFERTGSQPLILSSATIRSDNPLTLGNVMDGTLTSTTWRLASSAEAFSLAAKEITMAEKIEELEKQDSLRAVRPIALHLQPVITGTTNHALVLEAHLLII